MQGACRLVRPWLTWISCASLSAIGGCASEPASDERDPSEHPAGGAQTSVATADAGSPTSMQDTAIPAGCDLSGAWVTQHVTTNTALGAEQIATNWSYRRFEQDGSHLRIVESLDCGYVVRGSTDVALSDAALEAMAVKATHAVGVEGTLVPTDDGQGCVLELDRIYSIRGANREKFLDDLWQIGDPPKPLSEFTLPTSEGEGMEDWDGDGHEGITQLTGLGDRYAAQLDWYAFSGTLPLVGGALGQTVGAEAGVISADYDAIESVSMETAPLLRTSSVPMPPGYASMVRADRLARTSEGDGSELETCKRAQALAVETFGDPPKP